MPFMPHCVVWKRDVAIGELRVQLLLVARRGFVEIELVLEESRIWGQRELKCDVLAVWCVAIHGDDRGVCVRHRDETALARPRQCADANLHRGAR